MNGTCLQLALILATAIQQIVGGVSCCCLAGMIFGSKTQMVSKSTTERALKKPPCSKCKSKISTNQIENRKSGPTSKIHSDRCDCHLNKQQLAAQIQATELESHCPSNAWQFIASIFAKANAWKDLSERLSLLKGHFACSCEPTPAPSSTNSRLSTLGHWIL